MPGSHFQSAVLPRAVRELTDAEKTSLARSLPVNFNDPDSAKFRWLPVSYEPGSTQVEYCGLVNVKNSSRAFHAILQADPRGQFTRNHRSPKSGLDFGAKATGDAVNFCAVSSACLAALWSNCRIVWPALSS